MPGVTEPPSSEVPVVDVALLLWASAASAQAQVPCKEDAWQDLLAAVQPAEGRVEIELQPSRTKYKIGAEVAIRVVPRIAGRLSLFAFDADGSVFPLFPVTFDTDDRVEPGQVVQVPEPGGATPVIQPPLGTAGVLAIVRPEGMDELPLDCLYLDGAGPKGFVGEPVDLTVGFEPNAVVEVPSGWGFGHLAFEVIPRRRGRGRR